MNATGPINITNDTRDDGSWVLDVSLWRNITFQFVNPSGTFNFTGSNDSNPIRGVSDGNPATAINFTAIQAINLATGSAVTTASAAGLFKIEVFCKFVRIDGGTADKIIVFRNAPF
jgi:hypothetical protein